MLTAHAQPLQREISPFGRMLEKASGCVSMQPSDWYVGQSPPVFGASAKAIDAVEALGYEAWQPMEVFLRFKRRNGLGVWEHGKRVQEDALRPLFQGGYWFVRFSVADRRWGLILRERSVARILRSASGHPEPVRDGSVERLRQICRDDGAIDRREPVTGLAPGDEGFVLDGPFTSFPGTVIENRDERILVSVEIFGRTTPVELDRTQFQPLPKPGVAT